MEELKDLLEQAREKGDPAGEAAALHGMGRIYTSENVPDAAEECFGECISICREQGLDQELARALLDMGELAVASGEADRAGQGWQEALEISIRLAQPAGQAAALDKLGGLAAALGRSDEALDYFGRGEAICRSGNDDIGRLYFLEQMTPLLRAARKWDEAEKALRAQISAAEKFGDRERMALALVNLGDLVGRRDGAGQSVPYLQMAHDIYLRLGREREAAILRDQLAGLGVEPPPDK